MRFLLALVLLYVVPTSACVRAGGAAAYSGAAAAAAAIVYCDGNGFTSWVVHVRVGWGWGGGVEENGRRKLRESGERETRDRYLKPSLMAMVARGEREMVYGDDGWGGIPR